jgi:transcriptional regulator with XRE-family HTH domain
MTMNLLEIGKIILINRKSLGLTQKALAERARISRYTLVKLENGQASDIQFKTLTAILSELRLTIDVMEMPVSGVTTLGQDT